MESKITKEVKLITDKIENGNMFNEYYREKTYNLREGIPITNECQLENQDVSVKGILKKS